MDVTGYTAARMAAIEAASVVSGAVNGGTGHLILTKHDGSTIDAGSVVGPQGPTGPTGPLADAPNNTNHYVRKGGLWVPLEGTEMAALLLGVSKKYSAAINYGSTISSTTPTTIGTLAIPAPDVNSIVEVAAWWNFYFNTAGDTFYMLVQVDGVTKAKQTLRSPGVNNRASFSIPTSTLVTIAASVGSTVTIKIAAETASGYVNQENPGVVAAEVSPA